MKSAVRLVDGDRELVLYPSLDFIPQKLEVPSPDIRGVTEPRVDDDGERDSTVLFGARAVSLEVAVVDEQVPTEQLLDQLKAFLHPRLRPYLYVTDDGWAQERRIRLRVDQWSEPYEGYAAAHTRIVQMQWRAPDGVWEAADLVTVPNISADIPTTVGISFPITFPLSFPETQATGAVALESLGSVASHFTARLYGPCAAPSLVNETTGEEITFTSALVLGAGEYVEISTRDKTAYLLSDTSNSYLNYINFAATTWWQIQPGLQQVRYAPTTATAGAVAVIEYRPAWL